MQRFSKSIIVTNEHLDQNDHVNNVVYLQWAQAIAREHWQSLAPKEIIDHFYWVVLSHYIVYKAAAVLNDKIRISTYVPFAEGVKSTRIVEINNATTNTLLVKVETHWCFMNKSTKRPAKIPQDIVTLFD